MIVNDFARSEDETPRRATLSAAYVMLRSKRWSRKAGEASSFP